VCRAPAVDRWRRTNGPPVRSPTANATKRHEQPVVISNFSAEGCLPMYLPTSSCYSGYSDGYLVSQGTLRQSVGYPTEVTWIRSINRSLHTLLCAA